MYIIHTHTRGKHSVIEEPTFCGSCMCKILFTLILAKNMHPWQEGRANIHPWQTASTLRTFRGRCTRAILLQARQAGRNAPGVLMPLNFSQWDREIFARQKMGEYDRKDYKVVLGGAVRGTWCIITAKRCSNVPHTHCIFPQVHIATTDCKLLTHSSPQFYAVNLKYAMGG